MKHPLRLYLPTWLFRSIASIDFEAIYRKVGGQFFLLLDLDGTLRALGSRKVPQPIIDALYKAIEDGYILGVCIISNTGLKMLAGDVAAIAKELGFGYHACYIPNPQKPEPEAFYAALRKATFDTTCEIEKLTNVVVVDDQLGTGIVGANRCGFLSVFVRPMLPKFWLLPMLIIKWLKLRKDLTILKKLGQEFPKN